MEQVIGVRFKPAGKIYYFDSNNLDIHLDDGVIVETSRGKEYGYAVLFPKNPKIEGDDPLKPIIRKATMKDMAQLERNKEREKSAFGICLKKIEKYKIPMKLLRVEYTFDRNKIVFFFTSEGRVDFRELVKDLASVFHTRIELRQGGEAGIRHRLLRTAPLLRYVPRGICAGFHQDGEEPGPFPESFEDFRRLWPSHVLPAL